MAVRAPLLYLVIGHDYDDGELFDAEEGSAIDGF